MTPDAITIRDSAFCLGIKPSTESVPLKNPLRYQHISIKLCSFIVIILHSLLHSACYLWRFDTALCQILRFLQVDYVEPPVKQSTYINLS